MNESKWRTCACFLCIFMHLLDPLPKGYILCITFIMFSKQVKKILKISFQMFIEVIFDVRV